MKAVSREVAEKDVNAWLDARNIRDSKREAQADQIEALIQVFEDGSMVRDEKTNNLVYTIQNLSDAESPTKELTFKPRLKVKDVQMHLSTVKSTDPDQRILAYVCAMTGKAKGIIQDLDLEDYNVAQNIAIFFL